MSPSASLEDNGERMIPELHRPSLLYAEHLTRYLVAQEVVRGKRVLDIASGSGYGSHLLAETAASVVGVDVSEEAVRYATATFQRPNLEYRHGDAVAIPADDASVDVLVTFETIEHVADYRAFMAEIDRVLAPDGVALISTPNDLEFVEGNHFHLHEFVHDELLDLVRPHFAHIAPYFQGTWKAVAVGPEELFTTEGPAQVPVLNLAPLEQDRLLYFYLVCSRRPLTEELSSVLALGGHYSDRVLLEQEQVFVTRIDELQGRVRALEEELASARAEAAARAQDLRTVQATRSYRAARGAASVLARVTRRGARP